MGAGVFTGRGEMVGDELDYGLYPRQLGRTALLWEQNKSTLAKPTLLAGLSQFRSRAKTLVPITVRWSSGASDSARCDSRIAGAGKEAREAPCQQPGHLRLRLASNLHFMHRKGAAKQAIQPDPKHATPALDSAHRWWHAMAAHHL